MKKHHVNLLLGGLIGALTGLVLVSVDQDNGQYQAALIAQNGTATTTSGTPATPVEPTKDYSQPQGELDNVRNTLNQSKNDYQNRENELRNFKGQDITNLNNLMGQWKGLLGQMESAVNTLTATSDFSIFWDLNSQEDDMSRTVSDEFQKAYGSQRLVNSKNNALKEKPRQYKDIERQWKDLQRNIKKLQPQPDTTALQGHMSQLQVILNEMQTLANATTDDPETQAQDIDDLNSDYDNVSRDFYDTINELNQTVNNASNLENARRNLKDKQRNVKEWERELKKFLKNNPEQAQAANVMVGEGKNILAQIENATNAGDSETANDLDRDFWDKNTEINDLFNELRNIENISNQMKDITRILKEKSRQLKDMERKCARNKCENSEAGTALHIYTQMEAAASSGDIETFQDFNSQFDESNRTFWDLNQQKSQQKDITRWLKDTIREWNDKENHIKQLRKDAKRRDANVSLEGVEKLQTIHEEGIAHIQEAKAALENGDSETARDHLESLNDTRMQFDEIVNGFNKGRETEFARFELENAKRDIEEGYGAINEKLEIGEITQPEAEKCLGLLDQGRELLDQWRQLLEGGQIGEFEGDQKQVEIGFKKLEGQFVKHCGDIIDMEEENRPNIEGFTQAYIDEQFRGTAEDVFSRINIDEVANKLIEKLMSDANISNLFNSILEKVSQKYEEQIAKTMEAVSYMAESVQQQILSYKEGILEQLDASGQKYNEEIKNQIVDYNWVADTAEELDGKIQQGESITPQYLNTLKQKDLDYKFANRIIPAIDVPDNEWFFGYVTDAYNRQIVSGKDERHFDPGANVTIAEILKMVLNAVGSGELDEQPGLGIAQNHWASGYVAQAENLDLSIIKGLSNLNRPATRADVVKLILEAAVIEPEDGTDSSFKDVSGPDAGYIEKAKNLGIVSGDEGKGTFRPNASINRAEAAKIISNVVKLIEAESETSDSEEFIEEEDISTI